MKRSTATILAMVLIATCSAYGQSDWPPLCSIEPQTPTTGDPVTITLSGEWGDSCAPEDSFGWVDGNTVYFEVFIYYEGDVCADVVTPYLLSETVGPLAPGDYVVIATLHNAYSPFPPLPIEVCGFTVDEDFSPVMIDAVSRRTHGDQGEFDLEMSFDSPEQAAIECRGGGLQQVVLTFSEEVEVADGVPDQTEVNVSPGQVESVSIVENVMIIDLSGVPDASCFSLEVVGIQDLTGNLLVGGNTAHIRTLEGNTNGDGNTNLIDMAQVKSKNGSAVIGADARFDVNLDGCINLIDMAFVKARNGGTVTCPPRIQDYSNSGCLPGDLSETGDLLEDTYPCPDDDRIELVVESDTLYVVHSNATYNCCPDDIRVVLVVEGRVLRLTEEEIGGACDCLCCYDVETTIVGLWPGPYTVAYCWQDYETGHECYTEEITVP